MVPTLFSKLVSNYLILLQNYVETSLPKVTPLTPNQNTPLYSLQLLFIHPTIVRCLNYIILITKFSTNFMTLTDTNTLI